MVSEVADLWVKLSLLPDGFKAGLDEAGAEADGFGAKMSNLGSGLLEFGKKMLEAGAGVAAVSVKMAGDWQASMIKLTTSAGETGTVINGKLTGEIANVSDGLLKMSVATATSTKSLADGMYYVESAGFHGADGLTVMKAAAEGAKAEGADLTTVADALTTGLHDMGAGADQAVPFMNMMIKAVGDGKMTMEDFAGSLSNVVPIAHTAGISFPQVAGAIATMTLAGTSAQRATQDLGHAIQTMQNPSALAVKWMAQVGLSSTDLMQNLGSRGLTGTINLIDQAILNHMGPDGLALQSAFNKSQSAAQDLNVMLQAMPPNLKALAQQVQTGTMTAKDFNTATGDMPANLKAMASEFLTTYKNSSSFNAALRAGTPDARTFAGMLRQVTGDATTTNVALQLGGENMGTFQQNVQDVASASKTAGDNIETWGTITAGFNFKIDQAKQLLVTTGIQIGTFLLPKLMDLMSFVQDKGGPVLRELGTNIHDALDSPVIHEAEQVAEQLWRDVVAVFQDATTSTMNLWHALQPTAAFLAGAFLGAAQVVGGVFKDVIGPAVVAVTGFFKDHAAVVRDLVIPILSALALRLLYVKAIAAVDMFASFAASAWKGVGAVEAFIGQLARGEVFTGFRTSLQGASAAVQNLTTQTQEMALASEEAAGTQGFGAVASGLGKSLPIIGAVIGGIGYLSDKLGQLAGVGDHTALSTDKVASSMVGFSSESVQAQNAIAEMGDKLVWATTNFDKSTQGTKDFDQSLATLVQSGHAADAAAAVALMTSQSGQYKVSVKDITAALPQYQQALDAANLQQKLNSTSLDSSTTSVFANTSAMDANSQAAQALANSLQDTSTQQQDLSAGINASRAMDNFHQQLDAVKSSLQQNGTAISGFTQGAMNNRDALLNATQAIVDNYNAQVALHGQTQGSIDAEKDQITQLINTASQSSTTRQAIKDYIDSLNMIPKDLPPTVVNVDTSTAMAKLQALNQALGLVGGTANNAFQISPTSKIKAYGVGGLVDGPVGAPQLAIVHGGEYVVTAEEMAGRATPGNSAGNGGGGGYLAGGATSVYNFTIQGSVIAERDLQSTVETLMLQTGGRRPATYPPYRR